MSLMLVHPISGDACLHMHIRETTRRRSTHRPNPTAHQEWRRWRGACGGPGTTAGRRPCATRPRRCAPGCGAPFSDNPRAMPLRPAVDRPAKRPQKARAWLAAPHEGPQRWLLPNAPGGKSLPPRARPLAERDATGDKSRSCERVFLRPWEAKKVQQTLTCLACLDDEGPKHSGAAHYQSPSPTSLVMPLPLAHDKASYDDNAVPPKA